MSLLKASMTCRSKSYVCLAMRSAAFIKFLPARGAQCRFYKIVPHFDAQELRQYLHQVMATFSKTDKEVVMVVDRSGIHRAHKLDTTFDHYDGKLRFHFLPAHCGHHLNPIEGFWRVMKDVIGAGRCFPALHQLYQRTRHVLMAHQERPIYAFHW